MQRKWIPVLPSSRLGKRLNCVNIRYKVLKKYFSFFFFLLLRGISNDHLVLILFSKFRVCLKTRWLDYIKNLFLFSLGLNQNKMNDMVRNCVVWRFNFGRPVLR